MVVAHTRVCLVFKYTIFRLPITTLERERNQHKVFVLDLLSIYLLQVRHSSLIIISLLGLAMLALELFPKLKAHIQTGNWNSLMRYPIHTLHP